MDEKLLKKATNRIDFLIFKGIVFRIEDRWQIPQEMWDKLNGQWRETVASILFRKCNDWGKSADETYIVNTKDYKLARYSRSKGYEDLGGER